MIRPMSTSPRGPRERSAFAAAFLSLLFPGLGHLYAGAATRALGFAAAPFLSLALLGGIVLRANRVELAGFVVQQPVLIALFVVNALVFVYRLIAVVDAWQVARFLNDADGPAPARGRNSGRMTLGSVSAAGLLGVVLVMAGGHVAVARYNALALDLVNCVFTADSVDPSCTQPTPSPRPDASRDPSASADASTDPGATDANPAPAGSGDAGTPAPTLPPWNGTDRLNILLVGSDQRGNSGTFNTDTMIVASIDPGTGRVALFQVPRDSVGVPVPPNAQGLWGSTYAGKINSWFAANRNRADLWPGKTANTRGFAALKAILGNLYGININYYVMVNFQGFVTTVDTIGGVQVNVQIPVADSGFPITDGAHTRIYIPAGPQHMTGTAALVYARSRHGLSTDYDRGFRQQRVIVSLREQMNAQAILANLPALINALKTSVKTDVPTDQLPSLLALAGKVDTKGIRSYVFGPPYYAVDMWGPSGGTNSNVVINPTRVRQAASQAFSSDPAVLATREALGAEAATVWVLNGSGQPGIATDNADYLSYYGMNASAPNSKPPAMTATSKIVVYNGAEASLAKTIAFLEKAYGAQATSVTDPTVPADIVVTLGQHAPDLKAPAVGSIGPDPGIAQIADRPRL